ncbi:ABC transporter permease [Natronolimnohabitans sp. A-GB9]|uniref:ABC transporter permease n=1 Tax=Natronolimnohabitans sp. A-GB9 TaxID=3069757 RepID=UPI0027B2342A|nr:ABC transporter permease [Natronolimnohabitans sp. A-GB9]MDQ2052630.1 ABC transporter permease [Natronolimnohabitans sp. A-GB9]
MGAPIAALKRWLARLRVAAAVTVGQLRHHRLRLGLAIVGIALAVLSMTLLAGVGMGVLETGEQQFEAADRDLWVTTGETRLTTAGGGGFENVLSDSRNVSAEMESHEDVSTAAPLAFETVYVGTDPDDDFQTFVGTGVPGSGSVVQISEGEDLSGDPHYADGSYDGERTNEVLIDEETARALDVEVGETVHVGGSLAAARNTEATVVGISPTFEQMLGAPTVVMPLSELHQTTSTTHTEPATFITLTLEDGADTDAVQSDLQETYPEYEIRSNQEQLEAVLQEQALVLAAGGALVVLSLGVGIALSYTLLTLVVFQQRTAVAALTAQGVSSSLLVASIVGQGLAIGLVGGLLGVALTPPAVDLLNRLAAAVVGFDGLVQTDPRFLVGAFVVAIGIGTIAAALAGWRLSRTPPLEHL